jgi:branched-chain amino acid transport system ATP-binding protein
MLTVTDIATRYSESLGKVIRDVSIDVEEGEMVALIGPNGAGKTTTMRSITGQLNPVEGSIEFEGEDITDESPQEIVKRGISLVPEGRELFPYMTVEENLAVATDLRGHTDLSQVYDMFPVLDKRSNQLAHSLSGGEQQMLAISQALITEPELLLLDEPSLGLAPQLVDEVFEVITTLSDEGVTVLVVEQQAKRALEATDRAYVMQGGEVEFEGQSSEILESDQLSESYLR